ncbi:GHKL domain-containing protein [Paraburkholderia sp. NMBU_R16]|uniref:ATP-binding protein n=1 Tax=Paraburkholderia sp. NMBU_R16 TaxID=2698676 RepID=UPI0015644596|nr:ATP-binding protein [Paraburkholderia sp. NMBU_R16]NRO98535.1 GHKL domain-containing protein [Paraburkholderia sp. NMBU_R16]
MKLRSALRVRYVAIGVGVLACCALMAWFAYVEALRHYERVRAGEVAQRASFYALSLEAQLARYESLPRIAALAPVLTRLLRNPGDPAEQAAANSYLKAVQTNAQLAAAYLMDTRGNTLAASNWNEPGSFVGRNYAYRPYFSDAVAHGVGRFYGVGNTTGEAGYFLSVPIRDPEHPNAAPIGVVAIKAPLGSYEDALANSGDIVVLTDRDNVVFLGSVPQWRYRVLAPLSAEARAHLRATRQYGDAPLDALPGDTLRRYRVHYRPTGSLGWRIAILTAPAEDRQTAALAAIGAAAASALAFALAAALWLRHTRERERVRARLALQAAHRDLETRIAERTAELTQANSDLARKVEALDDARRILRDTRDAAIQAGKLAALGQMAAGITHELNQPLTALMTLSNNAVRLIELQRIRELARNLELINDLAARMGKIVAHVKAFARNDAVEREPVSIDETIKQSLALVQGHRKANDVTIRVAPIPDEAIALASAIRTEQVFVNLLTNAIDACAMSEDRKEVVVEAAMTARTVRVSFRDSGPGIAPEALPRLFEPFYTTKSAGKGLGLGLAISQAIVDEFGGSLSAANVEAEPGRRSGAVFVVELQRATVQSESTT